MRSSSWLYQYSSQTKFTYTICSGNQTRSVPYATGSQNNQQQDYTRSLSHPHSNDAQQAPNIRSSEQDLHGSSKAQLKDYARSTREDAEPVDMSISSGEHENRNVHVNIQHGHYALGQFTDRYKAQNKNSLNLSSYRAKFIQCHGQYNVDTLSPKYYITDLDKEYCCNERSSSHKRLQAKVLPAVAGSTVDPSDLPMEHWSSSPVWSDTLQRVPDVVHQELSPYVATPTTPVDTPDSELHTETPIFNFDWAAEQHVPNLKITFRSSNQGPRKVQDVQPITLQLPRKKGQSMSDSKDFPK